MPNNKQIPKNNYQITNKFQYRNSKPLGACFFGYCGLFVIWDLCIVIYLLFVICHLFFGFYL